MRLLLLDDTSSDSTGSSHAYTGLVARVDSHVLAGKCRQGVSLEETVRKSGFGFAYSDFLYLEMDRTVSIAQEERYHDLSENVGSGSCAVELSTYRTLSVTHCEYKKRDLTNGETRKKKRPRITVILATGAHEKIFGKGKVFGPLSLNL